MKTPRRIALKKMFASILGVSGVAMAAGAKTNPVDEKIASNVTTFQNVPLFSGNTKFGNLVFVAGKGAHTEPFEIKAHTEIVLQELEKELIKAGSSMEKVLKVSVFLNSVQKYAPELYADLMRIRIRLIAVAVEYTYQIARFDTCVPDPFIQRVKWMNGQLKFVTWLTNNVSD